jgi:hypothetical protein
MTTKNDVFEQWLRASGRRDASAWEPALDLYDSFRAFCVAHGAVIEGGLQEFSARLKRNLIPARRKYARGYRGYRLRQDGKRFAAWRERRLATHRANLNLMSGSNCFVSVSNEN